ncbi:hypothetical protein HPB47_001853, partial [Ixodes persulcatus]
MCIVLEYGVVLGPERLGNGSSAPAPPSARSQGRCNREKPPCKYFHPPQHLKDQLLINGRNHLALKNALLQQMPLQAMLPGQLPTAVVSPYWYLGHAQRQHQQQQQQQQQQLQQQQQSYALFNGSLAAAATAKVRPFLPPLACPSPPRPEESASYRSRGPNRVGANPEDVTLTRQSPFSPRRAPGPRGVVIELLQEHKETVDLESPRMSKARFAAALPLLRFPAFLLATAALRTQALATTNPYMAALTSMPTASSFGPYLTPSPCLPGMMTADAAPLGVMPASLVSPQKVARTDRLEVCREFQRGTCKRPETECRFGHPPEHVAVDSGDGAVTVCMDFVKGRCSRDQCRYFHPPPHLQAQLKATQSRAGAAAAAAAMATEGGSADVGLQMYTQ